MLDEENKARSRALERLYGLLNLQKEVEEQFGDKDYNIFIFGSYLTTKYEKGRMKFSEDVLKTLNLEPQEEREPVNVMQVADMLLFMKTCAERIVQKTKKIRSM